MPERRTGCDGCCRALAGEIVRGLPVPEDYDLRPDPAGGAYHQCLCAALAGTDCGVRHERIAARVFRACDGGGSLASEIDLAPGPATRRRTNNLDRLQAVI